MKKFRTYKHYVLIYDLQRDGNGHVLSIEKSCSEGTEKSSYLIFADECELVQLTLRLWRSGVTPMSLVYILEDEGYLPIKYGDNIGEAFTGNYKSDYIVKRDRSKNAIISKDVHHSFDQCEGKASTEKEGDTVKA